MSNQADWFVPCTTSFYFRMKLAKKRVGTYKFKLQFAR